MGATRKQPVEFRKEEVSYVMQCWSASDSCSLVGVGSVGKSNLLQHLADPDTQRHYLGNIEPGMFKAIIIDPNMLGPLPSGGDNIEQLRCWAGYELIMHRLFLALYPFEMLTREEAQRFYDTYRGLQDGTNPLYAYMGLRYFELGLDFFIRRGVRIVFMFDEFEEMMRQLPVKFFQTLRGIRDANKRQLSYLTFTRLPLPLVAEQLDVPQLDVEPFVELFTDRTHFVGPYNEPDARAMAENLLQRSQKNYPQTTIDFLLYATGRYAGLLRSAFYVLDFFNTPEVVTQRDEMVQRLAQRGSMRTELRTLWRSLSPIERTVLKAVAKLQTYQVNEETQQAVTLLVQKRLLRVDQTQNQLVIEPPVLRAFVNTNPDDE